MSTLTGQSPLQPLQDRHRSRASLTSFAFPAVVDDLAVHHLEEHPGPAARGILFVPRHHVAGTHRSVFFTPAGADADASQRRAGEAVLVSQIGKMGLGLRRIVVRAEAQIVGDPIGRAFEIDEFPGVHAIGWIPDSLELGERLHQFRTEHFGQEFTASLAVAMFAGRHAAEMTTSSTASFMNRLYCSIPGAV